LTRLKTALGAPERDMMVAGAILLGAGFVLSLAAAPAEIARRTDADPSFILVWRHGLFMALAAAIALGATCLTPREVRRVSGAIVVAGWALMVLVLVLNDPTKGARRWLDFGFFKMQPSEVLKPALVVLMAWLIAARDAVRGFPGLSLAGALLAVTILLLSQQPDFGQSVLLACVFVMLAFLGGVSIVWLAGACVTGGLATALAYFGLPHVRQRFNDFFASDAETKNQIGMALEAIGSGAVLGRGPGEGEVKQVLPEAHSDFVFAVAAEEFGWFALALLAVYAWIAWVGMRRAVNLNDSFCRLAASGLILLLTLQAAIHTAVNVGLAPTKGMTLPLVSYGGSSMIASALTLAFAFVMLSRADAPEGKPL
jgi:cell division protein FtsW